MNFLELARNRYTTKQYDTTKKVSDEDIEKLKEILQLGPSSINSQPWKFTIVSNEELKKKFAKSSFINESRVNQASHLVIFSCIDNLSVFEESMKDYLDEGSINYYNQMIKTKPETTIKEWLHNQVYISLGYFLSACAAMGIDSTPMEGIVKEEYDELLKIKDYTTMFAVAIGYRHPEDKNQPNITPKSRKDQEQIIEFR
ncbi:NAD(P)H-dependent oxidoreductase [Apibacter muscae]|uniref:NAD(P)H-dependent oxidoreductase n=1 Tax=Apibacter muscae TaxID=2509004 RepID=A0A563D7R7_9FLAO|nr:NAD(P)H-dependent oxidoreductase [Apibacter muscae]TWP26230.1 NAD(P)H-dependent oxidoreductase [Apibacter muscae]